MRAVVITKQGDPSVLQVQQRPEADDFDVVGQ